MNPIIVVTDSRVMGKVVAQWLRFWSSAASVAFSSAQLYSVSIVSRFE